MVSDAAQSIAAGMSGSVDDNGPAVGVVGQGSKDRRQC